MKVSTLVFSSLLFLSSCTTSPKVMTISDVWIRPSIGPNSAGFATIIPDADKALVAVEVVGDPISKRIELHTHIKEGDVMKMKSVQEFKLQKGKTFKLQPGGDHVMFMELVKELKEGSNPIKLRLKFRNTDGKEESIDVDAQVRKPQ